jgi:hypothetical protein
MIRQAKNSGGSHVEFNGKKIYFSWDYGKNLLDLGDKMDKMDYFRENIDESNLKAVQNLMIDWDLYENGWLVDRYQNQTLLHYLRQWGGACNTPPTALKYFK